MELELNEAIFSLCQIVPRLFASYYDTKDPGELDVLIYQVNKLFGMMRASHQCTTQQLEAVGVGLRLLQDAQYSIEENRVGYEPQFLVNGLRGRPRLDISNDQLQYLLELGFSCPQIANVLGVSLSTVRRRMTDYNLSVSAQYSQITDQELDAIVKDIKIAFPNCGYRLMHGHLLTRGHRITQMRIKEALHRVDPDGSALRWAVAIERRKYKVMSPLALWHIDSNHKLIR